MPAESDGAGEERAISPAVTGKLELEYSEHRKQLAAAVSKAEGASRAILPLAAAEVIISLGAGSYLPSPIRTAPTYPFIDLGLELFGVLVLGFYALSAAETMVYTHARLAELDIRLGLGVHAYFLRDFVEHATFWNRKSRLERGATRVACTIVGVKVRNTFVLSMAAIICWTGIAAEGIALVYLYVHPGILSAIAAGLAGLIVFGLLVVASRVLLSGGLPPTLRKMLASPEWMENYADDLAKDPVYKLLGLKTKLDAGSFQSAEK